MPSIELIRCGPSAAFPEASPRPPASETSDVLILAGSLAGGQLDSVDLDRWKAVLVELTTECLRAHTEPRYGQSAENLLGFSRFALGDSPPSDLVELVRLEETTEQAVAAARQSLVQIGFAVAVCKDAPGRIIERLVRPYFNSALWAVDEGRASAEDLDRIVELGLGYPEGPIRLLERTGLKEHGQISRMLFAAYGDPALIPAPRAAHADLDKGREP